MVLFKGRYVYEGQYEDSVSGVCKSKMLGRVKLHYKRRLRVYITLCIKKENDKISLSISGDVLNPKLTDIVMGGQMLDLLPDWLEDGRLVLVEDWTPKDLFTLVAYWRVWHLNDLNVVPQDKMTEYLRLRYSPSNDPKIAYKLEKLIRTYNYKWWYWEPPMQAVEWLVKKFDLKIDL